MSSNCTSRSEDRRHPGILLLKPKNWKVNIKAVSIDMSRAFESIVLEHLPGAAIVIDRFHVSTQLHKRVDEARRHIQNKQRKEDKARVFNIRWIILKNMEDLTVEELKRLNQMYEEDERLSLCHQLKEEFRVFFKDIKT